VKTFLVYAYLLFLAMVSVACGGDFLQAKQAQGGAHARPVTDPASLISQLRAAGESVELVGEVDQPFLSVTGTMIKLQGEDVQIFQYSSANEMEAQAALISPDGTAVGTRKIHWIGSPHFFKQGRILVLYVGNNKKVENALEAVLGRQFAGDQ
jgi:hypothetical protein